MKTTNSKEWLTKAEYNLIINNPHISRKDELIISILYGCALRVSELSNLKVKDITITEGTLVLWTFKYSTNPALVPIPVSTLKLINQWIKENKLKPKNYLLPSQKGNGLSRTQIYRIIQKNGKSAGIPKELTTHTLRSYAVNGIIEEPALPICLMRGCHWNR